MSNVRLVVEVVSAHDLMSKDGHGSSSAFVELHFDEQKAHTTIKEKDLNPQWNETFVFNISDSEKIPRLILDACVYSQGADKNSASFLGRVRLSGSSFVYQSDASVTFYPLEKRDVFSRVKGELGLRVFISDEHSTLTPGMEPMDNNLWKNESPPQEVRFRNPIAKLISKDKDESRRTFHNLPNSSHPPPNLMQIPEQLRFQPMDFGRREMKLEPQHERAMRMQMGALPHLNDFSLKETSPHLGGGHVVGGRVIRRGRPLGTHDLVEQMKYLFVRVVKARELPHMDASGSLDPYVEVRVGNYKARTRHFDKTKNPEWNEVFAFASDRLQASKVEVVVKDKDLLKDDSVGRIEFDMYEIPTRVPPDSPLVSEWYRLVDKKGDKKKGEVMLAVWFGTQADEAFPEAWHSDAISSSDTNISPLLRSKVYHSPRLWYLRVVIFEAQDLVPDSNRLPDAYVKVQLGNQILKTKSVQVRTTNPVWNDELMLIACEPFDDSLTITVEDRIAAGQHESLGIAVIPVAYVERRFDDRYVRDVWVNLERSKHAAMDEKETKKHKFHSRLHVLLILDGGYHVLDEPTQYSSDLRPSAKQLWKSPVGVLELGILNAAGLVPRELREGKGGSSDTYCVAKYGQKWVRTRTILDSLNPKYNEQYTWEVYDPATVLTVGVFDNNHTNGSHDSKDTRMGKVRIRISTLESGRVYTHTYPLLLLSPHGLKKMGELHLAIRFSCTSLANLFYLYSRPLLPKMHYSKPLTAMDQERLRQQAVLMVAARLGRAEPPLRKEVIEYISDTHSHLFSMRKSKANFHRLMAVFSGLSTASKWFKSVCLWKNPITSVLMQILFAILVFFPELILPTIFIYMILIGLWNFWYRPRHPPHMNIKLSCADIANVDELDEEFDEFPSKRNHEIVRWRYDRLRSLAGRIQTVVGDLATQGERFLALLSWRDSRATLIFLIFCSIAAIVCYVVPFQILALGSGMYIMRHPKLRTKTPSPPINFFRRLPAHTDSLL